MGGAGPDNVYYPNTSDSGMAIGASAARGVNEHIVIRELLIKVSKKHLNRMIKKRMQFLANCLKSFIFSLKIKKSRKDQKLQSY